MTITDDGASNNGLLDPGGRADTPATSTRRRGYKPVVALVLAAVVVGAGWWWSHVTVYGGVGNEFGARPDRLVSVYVAMVEESDSDRVRVIDGEPRVRVFGEAQAEVLLCDNVQIGIVYGDDAERPCFGPRQHGEDRRWDQIVLQVTPLRAGTVVVVDGIDLTYSTRFQRGTQHTGAPGVIVFPDE